MSFRHLPETHRGYVRENKDFVYPYFARDAGTRAGKLPLGSRPAVSSIRRSRIAARDPDSASTQTA